MSTIYPKKGDPFSVKSTAGTEVTSNLQTPKRTAPLADNIMRKIIYGFIMLFSLTAFSQDFKYCFSSRYQVTADAKGGYIQGEGEKIEGLFYFDMKFAYFELKGAPTEPLDFDEVEFEDDYPDIHEMVMVYLFRGPSGNFDIKLYQFLDRRIQIFSSYGGKKYLYVIDKVIDENGTVYSVKT